MSILGALRFWLTLLAAVAGGSFASTGAVADTFDFIDQDGIRQSVDARLYGEGQGVLALEKPDGSLEIVPQEAIRKRTPGDDPKPVTPEQTLTRLTDEFGEELFRGTVSGQYVVGVVLSDALPKTSERRVATNLTKSARYMAGIEAMFKRFCASVGVDRRDPQFPLVVLIFETDDSFNDYTTKHTGGQGLSAQNIAGFYSPLTNYLYVRMSECYTFATPLHEAIHQQCFNTGVLSRLAPIPVWFSEGIATGFEGNGDRVRSDPQKLNAVYAKLISEMGGLPRGMSWDDVVTTDQVFRGDIFAGEAYIHAWSMHWLLVSKYRKPYSEYLQYLSTLDPLDDETPRARLAKFEEVFEKPPSSIQREFAETFSRAMKRFRPPRSLEERPGVISRITNLAGVDVYGETNGLVMNIEAQIRNLSPLREMAFYVTVVNDRGGYVDWYIPRMKINQFMRLDPKGIRGPGARSFDVHVLSTPADSDMNSRWQAGQLPQLRIRRR